MIIRKNFGEPVDLSMELIRLYSDFIDGHGYRTRLEEVIESLQYYGLTCKNCQVHTEGLDCNVMGGISYEHIACYKFILDTGTISSKMWSLIW
jgi:hypothetical protein